MDPIKNLHNAALDLLEKRIELHNTILRSKELLERIKEDDEKKHKAIEVREYRYPFDTEARKKPFYDKITPNRRR